MSLLILLLLACGVLASGFNVGVGIWDTTGPATEINFMGYALPGQRGTGIHLRMRARAFVIQESGDKQDKVAYVSIDGGMASDLVKMRVLDQLADKFGKGVFTQDNVAISGTHSHSGPGGYLQYVLYQTTSLGYVDETFQAWVNGITQSIIMANENIVEDVSILLNTGTLQGANINRSPTSYLENPQVRSRGRGRVLPKEAVLCVLCALCLLCVPCELLLTPRPPPRQSAKCPPAVTRIRA